MTVQDREVLEALRDEPELLAIADALAATERGHPPVAGSAAWRSWPSLSRLFWHS